MTMQLDETSALVSEARPDISLKWSIRGMAAVLNWLSPGVLAVEEVDKWCCTARSHYTNDCQYNPMWLLIARNIQERERCGRSLMMA